MLSGVVNAASSAVDATSKMLSAAGSFLGNQMETQEELPVKPRREIVFSRPPGKGFFTTGEDAILRECVNEQPTRKNWNNVKVLFYRKAREHLECGKPYTVYQRSANQLKERWKTIRKRSA